MTQWCKLTHLISNMRPGHFSHHGIPIIFVLYTKHTDIYIYIYIYEKLSKKHPLTDVSQYVTNPYMSLLPVFKNKIKKQLLKLPQLPKIPLFYWLSTITHEKKRSMCWEQAFGNPFKCLFLNLQQAWSIIIFSKASFRCQDWFFFNPEPWQHQ